MICLISCFISIYSIEDDSTKKTLLSMIRKKWPIGRYTFTDIEEHNPGWLSERVKEFQVSKIFVLLQPLFAYVCFLIIDDAFDAFNTNICSNFIEIL